MPELWRKADTNSTIILWKSSESFDELLIRADLSKEESVRLLSFSSESRKREWLTVRIVVKSFLPAKEDSKIDYDGNGKPLLAGGRSISISHSGDCIAVMITTIGKPGIDIEHIHPRIINLARKFISEKEKKILNANKITEELHVIWGAKEVLYKIYSLGNVDFIKELAVHPFVYSDEGKISATISKENFQNTYTIFHKKIDAFMLTWATG